MRGAEGGRRGEVIGLLRAAGRPLTAREIADQTGLHVNTARFHLDALVRQGVLRRAEGAARGPGRPRTEYQLHPGMDRGGVRNYKLLAEMMLSHFAAEPDAVGGAVRAGQQWGRYLIQPPRPGQRITPEDALARVVHLLADVGFDPQLASTPEGRIEIRLRHCPFLELAETHRDLVCAMHLGLMRGALEQLDTPIAVDTLTPFADPRTCVAELHPSPAAGARATPEPQR